MIRSCGYPLTFNMLCPRCKRAHYDPAKRHVCVRWARDTRVRVLDGPAVGQIGTVAGVGRNCVYVRVLAGGTRKCPEYSVFRYLPTEVRRISGSRAAFPRSGVC